jgi:hypothetical protein
MGKQIVILSTIVEMSPFARYRMGYLDGYTGIDTRVPQDAVYTNGFEEGACDDRMGMKSKYDVQGHK